MGIVSELPPSNADSGEAVSGDELSQTVEAAIGHDLVMAGVMPHPSGLNPEKPHEATGEQMNPNIARCHNAEHCGHKQAEHETKGEEDTVTLLPKKSHLDEFGDEFLVILRDLGDTVIGVMTDEKAIQLLPRNAGVEGDEGIGGILSGEVQQREFTARMILEPFRDIVDLALDRDPQIRRFVMLLEFLRGNAPPFLVLHHHETEIQRKKVGFLGLKT